MYYFKKFIYNLVKNYKVEGDKLSVKEYRTCFTYFRKESDCFSLF